MKGRIIVWFGALMVLASMAGLFAMVGPFDRNDETRRVPVTTNDWKPGDGDQMRLPLGRYAIPSPGMIRAIVCPTPLADPHARLRVRASATSPPLPGDEALTEDQSRGKQCFDASYRGTRAGEFVPEIVVPRASVVAIHSVEVRASRRITPRDMWPVLLMLLGFVVVMSAPREAAGVNPAQDVPSPVIAPPQMPLGGIVPPDQLVPGQVPAGFSASDFRPPVPLALPPVVPASMPSSLLDAILGRPAPVRWRFAWVLALVVFVGDHIVPALVLGVWAAMSGIHISSNPTGMFFAMGLFVQHGLLVLTAFWFLGAFTAPDRRAALGLVPTTPLRIARAVGLAFMLVGIARVVTTLMIKQSHETPMGQLVERMPVRFVIGYGALLAPFSEELFFRGVFYGAFAKRSKWVGIIGSTAIFTAAHAAQLEGARVGLVPIACVGFVNAVLRAESGGLTEPWIVHTTYNAALSAGLYFG